MEEMKKTEELVEVSFNDIETVEEIVTGATSGILSCCVDVG